MNGVSGQKIFWDQLTRISARRESPSGPGEKSGERVLWHSLSVTNKLDGAEGGWLGTAVNLVPQSCLH
jgi:hypothetical protein